MPEAALYTVEDFKGAPAEAYLAVFMRDPQGRQVLEDLQARFYDRPLYVKGGPEGGRETDRRVAQRDVVAWIHQMIARAQQPKRLPEP